jgi:hypothetical protein
MVELFMFVATITIQWTGLQTTFYYSLLILLQVMHAFTWVTSLAISSGMSDPSFIIMYISMYSIAGLFDFAAVGIRTALLLSCSGGSCTDDSTLESVYSWVNVAVIGALTLLDATSVFLGFWVLHETNMHKEQIVIAIREMTANRK